MSDKRPDPRHNGIPEGYAFEFKVKPHETDEDARSRVLAQGAAATRLLTDPDFNAAYQEILEEQLQQIVTSKPGQDSLREDAYFRIRGIQEIAYKFNTWRTLADRLRQQDNAQESDV